MTRSALLLLGRSRGSGSLLEGLLLPQAGDYCSTSGRSCITRLHIQFRRSAHRYNFIQTVDTNHIDALLNSATVLEHAALPVLQYGEHFDPEQVTRTLQRVPRMLRYQRRKLQDGASRAAVAATASTLLDALGPRFAAVMPDCSDEQLARALWAYGVSRHPHEAVLTAACRHLPDRLASMAPTHLATAAWALAAAATPPAAARDGAAGAAAAALRDGPVRQLLQEVALQLVEARPALAPPHPDTAHTPHAQPHRHGHGHGHAQPQPPPHGLRPAAEAAGAAALAADAPWLDHRAAVKLAWAFAAADVREPRALDVLADAAVSRITSQLREHNAASGPLAPRATYLYRTVRGWQAWPKPRPRALRGGPTSTGSAGTGTGLATRGSRYLYDDRPRVVLRDFTLPTLAPLLQAFRRLGHRHDRLLQASAEHVLASGAQRVAPRDLLRFVAAHAHAHATAPALAHAHAHTHTRVGHSTTGGGQPSALPDDDLGTMAGGGGAASGSETGSTSAAGAAATRAASREALAALLRTAVLSSLPAPLLLRLTCLAAEWRVSDGTLHARLVRQLVARVWVHGGGGDVAAGTAGEGKRREGEGKASSSESAAVVVAAPAAVAAAPASSEAASAGTASATADADGGTTEAGELRLDPHALRSKRTFWGGGAEVEVQGGAANEEAAAWDRVRHEWRDACSPAQVARLLLALARMGYTGTAASHPDDGSEGDLAVRHFADLLLPAMSATPHAVLDALPRAAAADLARAAALLHPAAAKASGGGAAAAAAAGPRLPAARAEALLRAAANVALHGTASGKPSDRAVRLDLLQSVFGGAGGAAAPGVTPGELRVNLGISHRAAARLAVAAASVPGAVPDRDLKAALALLERGQLGEGARAALEARLGAERRDLLPERLRG